MTDVDFTAEAPPREPLPPRREAGSERRRRRRRTLLVVAIVVALVLVPIALVGTWFAWQVYGPAGSGSSDSVEIVVEPGWGTSDVASALADHGVVSSALAFELWARIKGATFQAGTYRVAEDMNVSHALDAMARGPSTPLTADQHALLLPPGLTLSQIADRVAKIPGHTRDAFLAASASGVVRSKYQPAGTTSLEGLTWPDTYFIGNDESDAQILQTIVGAFDRHADAAGLSTTTSGLTPYQTVVVASLVQGEAGGADQPVVAGVILNRLHRNMSLQIDATLCYVKPGGCPPVPSNADKQIDSSYNTYRVTGLPPTPILTVTDDALRAAAAPASHAYLYYVTGKDGVTRFSETLAGQEENIKKFGVRGE